MTALLKQAFAAASQLPDSQQDDLDDWLLREVGERTSASALTDDASDVTRWIAEWRAWAAKPRARDAALEDSRESIYAGRLGSVAPEAERSKIKFITRSNCHETRMDG